MFSNTIKATVKDAVTGELATGAKWVKAGEAVRAEIATSAGLDAVRAKFIDDVIVPALGKDAVAALGMELPRKNSTEYAERCAKESGYAAQWHAANEAKKTVRGTASVMYGRVRKYAYGDAEKGPSEPRSLKTRTNEDLAALIKAHEKAEDGNAEVIKYLELALKANNK